MAKKKLNLFELTSASMAETRATAAQIVGCKIVDADLFSTPLHRVPDYVGSHARVLSRSVPQNLSKYSSLAYARTPPITVFGWALVLMM